MAWRNKKLGWHKATPIFENIGIYIFYNRDEMPVILSLSVYTRKFHSINSYIRGLES